MMLDISQPASSYSPLEDAYLESLEATWPARPFPLFDLPRELRDNIYDYALVENSTFQLISQASRRSDDEADRDVTPRPEDALDESLGPPAPPVPCLTASVKLRASTNLLLAGSSLKQEYEERAKQNMVVVLKDHDHYGFQPVKFPEQATTLQNLELHLVLFCHDCLLGNRVEEKSCHAAGELNSHRAWIEKLLPELKELRSLTIHAYLAHDRYRTGSKDKIPCERIVEPKFQQLRQLPNVKKLTLCKYDYHSNPDLDGPKAVIFEWPTTKKDQAKDEEVAAPELKKEVQTEKDVECRYCPSQFFVSSNSSQGRISLRVLFRQTIRRLSNGLIGNTSGGW